MLWNKEKSKKEKEIRMPPVIKKDVCIGCGACVAVCPEGFELGSDGKAKLKNKNAKCIDQGISACPVQAIIKK